MGLYLGIYCTLSKGVALREDRSSGMYLLKRNDSGSSSKGEIEIYTRRRFYEIFSGNV